MQILPVFKPTIAERQWIGDERETAKIVRLLWEHSSKVDHSDPEFLKILIRSSWINGGSAAACLALRNRHIAEWLSLDHSATDSQIADVLGERLGMSPRDAKRLVRTSSGITDYYKAYRTVFLRGVERHAKVIGKAFRLVSRDHQDVEAKITQVASEIFSLPTFRTPTKGHASMMNGLAPALACLDPQCRFPIMNVRTQRLLAVLGNEANVQGALSLSRLIGQYGIKDSFYLDVYASNRSEHFRPIRRGRRLNVPEPRTVGLKAEEQAVANLEKRKVVIRKRHNMLVNQFLRAVEWKYIPKESEYDLLIEDWKPGRWLLIEAKTETSGVTGRSQLRQAIGQLFDYRWRSFHATRDKVDLALLTPVKPHSGVLALLAELGIEALWFDDFKLKGTVSLT